MQPDQPFKAGRSMMWLGAAALVLALRLPALSSELVDTDEATYAAIAVLQTSGAGPLYEAGGVDNKPPGIYWVYAAVFRVFGDYSMLAVHWVAAAVVLATGLLLGMTAALYRSGAGIFAFLFYGVFAVAYYPKMMAANTELFMALPLAGSFYLAVSLSLARPAGQALRRFAAAGALVGLACLFKPVGAACLLVPLAVALRQPTTRSARCLHAAATLIGASIPVLVAVGILWLSGALPGYLHWGVSRLASHYAPLPHQQPSEWGVSFYVYALVKRGGWFIASTLLLWLTLAVHVRRWALLAHEERLALGWFASLVPGVFAGGHFFGHYFLPLVAPLSVIAAVHVRRWAEGSSRALLLAVALACAIPAIGFSAWAWYEEDLVSSPVDPMTHRFFGGDRPEHRLVARRIRETTRGEDSIFVWGMYAPIYVESGRRPASRFVGFMRGCPKRGHVPMERCWDAGPEVWPALLDDLRRARPSVIVDTATSRRYGFAAFPLQKSPLAQFVALGYQPAELVDGVRLYRLKEYTER
jgi:4-amino-4-deoxy-L-arabinose transferase-like glycosyltransferase